MTWNDLNDHVEVGMLHRTLYLDSPNYDRTLLETIDLITHDLFFDRIELPKIKDPAIRSEIKKRLHMTRVKTTYATSATIFEKQLDINSVDPAKRRYAIDELKACFEDALDFGADHITMISGPTVEEPATHEKAKRALADSVIELSGFAEKLGLSLQLEIHAHNIDKKRLLGPTKDAVELLSRLEDKCPAFSFLIDNSHFPLLGESIEESVFPLKNNIGYVHIGSCVTDPNDPRYGDKHPYFGYPAGENDTEEVAAFLKALSQVGYLSKENKAKITIEIINGPGERPEDLIVNGKRTLREAWSLFKKS
jgi:sugar phosphate isomerase/epimerase